jgi:hypothetical protein
MTAELHKKVQILELKTETLEKGVDSVVSALNENTKVTSELVKEVAVLISKSDESRKSSEKELLTANKKIEKLESSVIEMGKIQSQHIPVVNGVRNIVWKIFGSTLIGMGGIAGLVAVIIKMSSGE